MLSIESENIAERMGGAVDLCREMYSRKVGNNLIVVNKEASMQLQYAALLKQILPLITLHENETFEVELEVGVDLGGQQRVIDLLFIGQSDEEKHRIAIEVKYIRKLTSYGKENKALDIYMRHTNYDFYLLEQYIKEKHADEGIALVMTDSEKIVNPKNKDAKYWDYDISDGTQFSFKEFNTPVGNRKHEAFTLELSYRLNWHQHGRFWFMKVQGE